MRNALIRTLFLLILVVCPVSQTEASSKTGQGALIGGLSGAGVGLAGSLIVMQRFSCGTNPGDETCASGSTQAKVVAGSTAGLAAVGAGLGALIGALAGKKDVHDIALAPTFASSEKDGTAAGLSLTKGF